MVKNPKSTAIGDSPRFSKRSGTYTPTADAAASASIGNAPATVISVISDTQLLAQIGEGATTGPSWIVVITNAGLASSNDLPEHFSYADDPALVVIDLSDSRIWDASTVAVLDAIEAKYHALGTSVEVHGLDARSKHANAIHLTLNQ